MNRLAALAMNGIALACVGLCGYSLAHRDPRGLVVSFVVCVAAIRIADDD